MAAGCFHAKTIQHGAEHFIVVEAIDEGLIERHLIRHGAVHHALVQVGGAQPPDLAGEHDVMAVMHLRQVIERAGLLGKRQHVFAAIVLDGDIAFFDIDIRRAVFAHGSQFDQVALRPRFAQSKQQVERADYVVDLGEDGVVAVDHRIRGGTLLGEMHHRVRLNLIDGRGEKLEIGNIAGI